MNEEMKSLQRNATWEVIDLPGDSEEICNAVAFVLGDDISAMAVETDDVIGEVLPLRFGALEGSHHSGYLIKS